MVRTTEQIHFFTLHNIGMGQDVLSNFSIMHQEVDKTHY